MNRYAMKQSPTTIKNQELRQAKMSWKSLGALYEKLMRAFDAETRKKHNLFVYTRGFRFIGTDRDVYAELEDENFYVQIAFDVSCPDDKQNRTCEVKFYVSTVINNDVEVLRKDILRQVQDQLNPKSLYNTVAHALVRGRK